MFTHFIVPEQGVRTTELMFTHFIVPGREDHRVNVHTLHCSGAWGPQS